MSEGSDDFLKDELKFWCELINLEQKNQISNLPSIGVCESGLFAKTIST